MQHFSLVLENDIPNDDLTDERSGSSTATPCATLAPWEVERYKLWSLLDLYKHLKVSEFSTFMINFDRVVAFSYFVLNPIPASPQDADRILHINLGKFREALSKVLDICAQSEIPISFPVRRQIEAFTTRLSQAERGQLDHHTLIEHARLARQALLDDLSQHLFIFVPAQRRELIEQTEPPFGASVAQMFSAANRDIEASCRCFALSEWTACVFHAMRVVEHGLRQLAEKVELPADAMAHENWKNIIDQIEARIRDMEKEPKSTEKSAKLKFYSSAAIQFRYFKDAWRNHVSHGRDTYDEREAYSIWNHVKEFMQTLANELKELPHSGF